MDYPDVADFSKLVGKTLISVEQANDELHFVTEDGEKYKQYHSQSCCENVSIEEIIGDLTDLVGSPILHASETGNQASSEYGSQTWTFYNLSTIKGSVTIRWFGESNGYYSESVDFGKVDSFEEAYY